MSSERAQTPRAAESRQPLWIVPGSPVVWALHFMACYFTAALWCGMVVGREGSLAAAHVAIASVTLVALALISYIGWRGWRAHTRRSADMPEQAPPHDDDTPEDRHRFLGFATVLLSGLSGVAVIYSALAFVFIRTCQ